MGPAAGLQYKGEHKMHLMATNLSNNEHQSRSSTHSHPTRTKL